MLLDHLPSDGKSQADAIEEFVSAPVEVIETVEDARQGFARDANSLVLHTYADHFPLQHGSYLHTGTGRTKLDRIIHEGH